MFRCGRSRQEGNEMSAIKIVAIVLIVAGILGVMYGKFSYTKETHDARLGPLELSVKEKRTVNVPAWAGVGAIAAGAILLLVRTKS
jgi:uncharacterized membrane protein YdcZ (DUF606 family)